jgi:hypothetical protein
VTGPSVQVTDAYARPNCLDAQGACGRLFQVGIRHGWDTTKEPPIPSQQKPRMDETTIYIGTWSRDLPVTGRTRHTCRSFGQPAYLTIIAVPLLNTLDYKAKDARGSFASPEHIRWANGAGRLSVQKSFQLCTKAEAAFVTGADSWNAAVGVYKARLVLRSMCGHIDREGMCLGLANIELTCGPPPSRQTCSHRLVPSARGRRPRRTWSIWTMRGVSGPSSSAKPRLPRPFAHS